MAARRTHPILRRCAAALAVLPAAEAWPRRALPRQARAAQCGAPGAASGAYVVNADTGKPVFRYRYDRPRILASNTKLFTTAAALARFGVEGTAGHRGAGRRAQLHRGRHLRRQTSTWSAAATPPSAAAASPAGLYGAGAAVEELAALLEDAGIRRVTGRIYGDESRFDSRRGGPESALPDLPVRRPAQRPGLQPRARDARAAAATRPTRRRSRRRGSTRALARRDISVRGAPRAGVAPVDARVLAADRSHPRWRAWPRSPTSRRTTSSPRCWSRTLPARPGRAAPPPAARAWPRGFARRIGGRPSRLADGSGLSRGEPRVALPGGEAAAGHAQARRVRGVLRLALDRGPRRHAPPADAPRPGSRAAAAARPGRSRASRPCRATAAPARARRTSSRS